MGNLKEKIKLSQIFNYAKGLAVIIIGIITIFISIKSMLDTDSMMKIYLILVAEAGLFGALIQIVKTKSNINGVWKDLSYNGIASLRIILSVASFLTIAKNISSVENLKNPYWMSLGLVIILLGYLCVALLPLNDFVSVACKSIYLVVNYLNLLIMWTWFISLYYISIGRPLDTSEILSYFIHTSSDNLGVAHIQYILHSITVVMLFGTFVGVSKVKKPVLKPITQKASTKNEDTNLHLSLENANRKLKYKLIEVEEKK